MTTKELFAMKLNRLNIGFRLSNSVNRFLLVKKKTEFVSLSSLTTETEKGQEHFKICSL